MHRFLVITLALATLLVSAQASAQMGGGGNGNGNGNGKGNGHGNKGAVILSFTNMAGVNGPFLGAANPLRGIDGDTLPWVVRSAKGTLTSSGRLSLAVKGLVFPSDDPNVPAELQGTNDEENFRAVVSCVTLNGGVMQNMNVTTEPFPASPKGNAKVRTTVSLPQPCLTPAVFIISGDEEDWFAVTGGPPAGSSGSGTP